VRKALILALIASVFGIIAFAARNRGSVDPAPVDNPRNEALKRAQVLRPPRDPASLKLGSNPPDLASFGGSDDLVSCRYQPDVASGTSPKFDCVLPSGEVVKIKYGENPELAAEVAATRLLDALGFGADRMYMIRQVRCYGCPANPYRIQQAADLVRGQQLLEKAIDFSRWTDFEWAALERELDAPAITPGEAEGWAWWELKSVESSRGGASRAELDAFRLMAVFLAHWDNKAENQRLVCLSGETRGRCAQPFAMIQDTGATFGPPKAYLDGWRAAPIWSDAQECRVSMKGLPHRGGTFEDVSISEEGRRLLASRLAALSEAQVRELFLAARMASFDGSEARPGEVDAWVRVCAAKVREITDRAPCPQ
jgi:hypothetical protein